MFRTGEARLVCSVFTAVEKKEKKRRKKERERKDNKLVTYLILFATHASLVYDVTDTAGHEMAALMIMFSRLSNTDFPALKEDKKIDWRIAVFKLFLLHSGLSIGPMKLSL